jgi:4-carboxymuconolactone decarboxylase
MPELGAHTEAALKIGATKQQIVETMLSCYTGRPAVRNALVLLEGVFAHTAAS